MKEIQTISLVLIVGAAALCDLRSGRIPNGLIVTGLLWGAAYQIIANGAMGAVLFLGGILLPAVLFGAVYYFRMIGAGDIKLLCMIGGFLGPLSCFSCMVASILFGGLISLAVMLRHHNFCQRLLCFSEYISDYSREKHWKPYLAGTGENARFCFSVPVLLGVLCYVGGIF